MTAPDTLTPFPVLMMDEPVEAWRWPAVPYEWRHVMPPDHHGAQPCRLDTVTGSAVQGFMLGLDPAARSIAFRTTADAPAIDLPFARFRRLVLTSPLRSIDQVGLGRAVRVPVAAQQRDYRLHGAHGVTTGRTCGHVENEVGLFLFAAGADDYSLVREFIPRGAFARFETFSTAQDSAAEKWIACPAELLAAADRQRRMSIRPIGCSLVELGLVTPEQLDHELAQPAGDLPLGERLVRSGLISQADLQTAIAHKMGYPFVDLKRFPIDPAIARKLPLRTALAHRALPIHLDQDRLFVATDRPSRAVPLGSIFALKPYNLVPVLASKGQILLALSKLSDQDPWQEHVAIAPNFANTTV